MKKYFLSYSTTYNHYYSLQQKTAQSFLKFNEFDTIFLCTEKNIKPEYIQQHKDIFLKKEGTQQGLRGTFFIWKPYIIYRTLVEKLDYGDILFYADCTIDQLNSLSLMFEILQEQSFIPFMVGTHDNDERGQTKRDALILMECDKEKYFKPCFLANHIFLKKDEKTLKIIKDWLTYAENERILTDMPNTLGVSDHDLFLKMNGHRWDQSILSCVLKKYYHEERFKYFHDLTQYGNIYRSSSELWGQLLHHGR